MSGHGFGRTTQSRQQPFPGALRIGHGFQSGERFGRNYEECFRGIQITRCLHKIRAIHVRDEPEGEAAITIIFQRLIGHHGAKIRSADANIDNVLDPLAGMSFPFASPDAIRKRGQLVQDSLHLRHDVLTIDENAGAFWSAQRHV